MNTKLTKIPVLSCDEKKECFFSTHCSTLHTLCLWVIDLKKIPTIQTSRSKGCHQNEWVSSKVKKQMGIIEKEVENDEEANGYHQKGSSKWASIKSKEVNGYHQKGRKPMGILKGEGSEWVSSKGKEANGYHQKGRKPMGILKGEGSEWVSSKGKEVNGYHQKGRKQMGIIRG